jgi:predicted GIY-YIG superfamily endonuclease
MKREKQVKAWKSAAKIKELIAASEPNMQVAIGTGP